jgi:hypothetical protein
LIISSANWGNISRRMPSTVKSPAMMIKIMIRFTVTRLLTDQRASDFIKVQDSRIRGAEGSRGFL